MKRIAWVALAGVLGANPLAAQTAAEQSAYRAMIYTPVAALPPLAPSFEPLGARSVVKPALYGRLGHMSRDGGLSLNTMGVGIEIPTGRWRLAGTFAYMSASCGIEWEGDTDCSGDIMLGGSVRTTLTRKPLSSSTAPAKGARRSTRSGEGSLVVGFEGSAGFSPRQGEQALAVSVGLPTGIAFQNGSLRIMPFLTPGLGYGRMGHTGYDDEVPRAYGSQLFLIGGGLGLQFGRSGIGATFGFQKVLKSEGGATQLGVNMTWQGLTSR